MSDNEMETKVWRVCDAVRGAVGADAGFTVVTSLHSRPPDGDRFAPTTDV